MKVMLMTSGGFTGAKETIGKIVEATKTEFGGYEVSGKELLRVGGEIGFFDPNYPYFYFPHEVTEQKGQIKMAEKGYVPKSPEEFAEIAKMFISDTSCNGYSCLSCPVGHRNGLCEAAMKEVENNG